MGSGSVTGVSISKIESAGRTSPENLRSLDRPRNLRSEPPKIHTACIVFHEGLTTGNLWMTSTKILPVVK